MGRREPVDLGHTSFPSKKAAREYFQQQISNHQPGDAILQTDAFFRDVGALLDRHPECEQKIGSGIERFMVILDDARNKALRLRRIDGTETDFSYITCINGYGKSLAAEFAEAARFAIRPQIVAFREAYFAEHADAEGRVPCQETGIPISVEESHVDHFPVTFKQLVRNFLEEFGITPTRAILSAPEDNQTTTTFTCPKTERLFMEYHWQHAELKIVEKRVNLTRKRT